MLECFTKYNIRMSRTTTDRKKGLVTYQRICENDTVILDKVVIRHTHNRSQIVVHLQDIVGGSITG